MPQKDNLHGITVLNRNNLWTRENRACSPATGCTCVLIEVSQRYKQIIASDHGKRRRIWGMKGGSDKSSSLSKMRLLGISTLIALIISIPALIVTVLMHYLIKTDLLITLSLGLLTLFIGMGAGYRISKKFVTLS
jgi:hypothetical protein